MTKKNILLLALIFILGLSLRFYRLNLNLPELYIDETGGQYLMRLSLVKPGLGTSPLALTLFYNIFSFTTFFGLTPLGARSAAALFSGFIPVSAFIFFNQIKHKQKTTIALLGAFFTSLLPWSFLIARIAHVHIPIIVSLSCLSAHSFLKHDSLKSYLLSLTFLGLAAFYYPSIIFIAPFHFLLILYYASLKLTPPQKQKMFTGFSLLAIGLVIIFFFKYGGFGPENRGVDLAIWRDPNTIYDTNHNRGLSWISSPSILTLFTDPKNVAPLAYNKVTANLAVFTRNYLSFFSFDWLFLRGDAILRHSTGQIGYFYPVLIPFLIYGAFRFFRNSDKKTQALFIVWIFASPLAAAITKDGAGYLLRGITLLPFLTYFIALGIVDSLNFFTYKTHKFFYSLILTFLICYSAFYFFYGYFHVYPYQTSTARAYEYGFKDLSDFQTSNDNAILLIIWDGYYPLGHFVFWQNVPPQEFAQYKLEEIVIGESHFHHPSPNLYFVKPYKSTDVDAFIKQYQPDYLVLPDPYYLRYPGDLVGESAKPVKIINYPNGEPNFTIYRL